MKLTSVLHQKMGNVSMKRRRGKSKEDNKAANDENLWRFSRSNSLDEELEFLRQSIVKNPQNFILNNLMMCVPFFGNYAEEIELIKEKLMSSREAELNDRLPVHKHVLLPDVLHEHVARNVVFKSKWQTLLPTIELLQSVRIYVVHDNIEITEQNNPPQYSSVNDTITYNMLLEKGSHSGYAKLRLLEKSQFQKKISTGGKIRDNEDQEFDSDDDSVSETASNSRVNLSQQGKQNALQRSASFSRSEPNLTNEKSLYETRSTLSRDSVYGMHSTYNINAESDYERSSQHEEGRSQKQEENEVDSSKRLVYQRNPKRQYQPKIHWTVNRSPASSISSGYKSGTYVIDSDSDCGPNTQLSNRDMLKNPNGVVRSTSNAEIPAHCFKKIKRTKDGKVYDPREERKQLQNERQLRNWNAWKRYNYDVFYASSLEFMRHFVNLFVNKMAVALNFDEEAIDQVKVDGCVIYCDKQDCRSKYSKCEPYEIIPAVRSQWPEECAQEWLYRTTRKSWPDDNIVKKIREFGCYLIPEGFPSDVRVGDYLQQDLEWQFTFPAAERFLETCLTHAQVHVYLMAVTLHKTFLQSTYDTIIGLTTSHIRNKLFWMIEQYDRPSQWPENKTGECLLHLLKSIYQSISQYEPSMEDYFVKDKNLFQKIPRQHLLHTQKQLQRIIDNPVMYIFHAMENLKYSRDFFPKPNYKRLFEILTVENSLALVNPYLGSKIYKPLSIGSDREYSKGNVNGYDKTATKKDSEKSEFASSVNSKTLINTRKATDSIIEIPIRCRPIDDMRLSVLLDFFVSHFIKLAKRYHQYDDVSQKTVYLDQAERLSILLSEHPQCVEKAKTYREEIKVLREIGSPSLTMKFGQEEEPPETPKRNVEAPIFVRPLNDRFSHESPEPTSILKVKKDSSKSPLRVVQIHPNPSERESLHTNNEPKPSTSTDYVASDFTRTKFVTIAESNEESFLSDSTYI